MVELSDPDLNRMYAASLEFGPNWRRPLRELAEERFPTQPVAYRDALCEVINDCRDGIELYVEQKHVVIGGKWSRSDAREVDAWIASRYPWMTRRNRRHGLRQGQYYAWHDHG